MTRGTLACWALEAKLFSLEIVAQVSSQHREGTLKWEPGWDSRPVSAMSSCEVVIALGLRRPISKAGIPILHSPGYPKDKMGYWMQRSSVREEVLYIGQSLLHSFTHSWIHACIRSTKNDKMLTRCYDYKILSVWGQNRWAERACDQSLPLAIFMPSPHCLQEKGKGGADGSVGISAPGWWGGGRPPALMLHYGP